MLQPEPNMTTPNSAKDLCPSCVNATYTPQRLPHFKGNPMIEALPPPLSEEDAFRLFSVEPAFEPEQRTWSRSERVQMLTNLQHFMFARTCHLELGLTLDAMIRNGYVGRAPLTPEHVRRFEANYHKHKAEVPFALNADKRTPQLSALLIGPSGMGKTTSVRRWLSHLPQVIYHPEHNVYQVTYLHVEMPSDGASIKGLAHGILQQLDRLIPGANYYNMFAHKSREGADTLMRSVARVLNAHLVGCLVADEVQNLANAHKGAQVVMTELVSACNDLGVPILFIGTNKATRVFKLDFRQSRRASGHGLQPWERMQAHPDKGQPDEWREFMRTLWAYQWLREPTPPSDFLFDTFYHYSQGILDIAVKLFASCQARAIVDGSEQITAELIAAVYKSELHLLHPMIEALRDDDFERLAQYEDVAPIGLSGMLENAARKLRAKEAKAYAVKPDDPTFVLRVASSLVSAGIDEDDATAAAKEVVASGKATNLLAATKAALALLTTPRKTTSSKGAAAQSAAPATATADAYDANDYRRAVHLAREQRTSIYPQLVAMGVARPLQEVLSLT